MCLIDDLPQRLNPDLISLGFARFCRMAKHQR